MAATGSEKQNRAERPPREGGGETAFYVSTPIYYVNDAPHLGHAYTTVAGDVLTRWHRQRGERVWYLTGTDEHGQKIMRTAEANGVSPQEWCDRLVEEAWKPLWEHLEIANDDFIRTTQPRHTERVQEFVQDLYDKGEIYKGGYEGPYCVGCEEYKAPGELLDGEGGYTVVGRLMPASDSLAQGCLPLGLAHGWKLLKPVAAGQPLRWSDVAVDESMTAVRLRREMETQFRARERHAA